MEATQHDLESLLKLQEVDMSALNAQRKIDALPQRAALQELAEKKQVVVDKRVQVEKMYEAARRKVTQLEDEEDILHRKQEEVQAKIDEAAGDFRAVQSLTRDLDGMAKRLDTLAEEKSAAMEKYNQVNAVKKQVGAAVKALDAQALQLRDSYQRELSEFQETLAHARGDHDALCAGVSPSVLKAYDEACKSAGGIGVSLLSENRCSMCRNILDANRLLVVKREAPISRCPACRRLLIVG